MYHQIFINRFMYSFSLLVPVNVNLFLFEFRILIIFSFVILILNGCDFDLYPYDWNCRININSVAEKIQENTRTCFLCGPWDLSCKWESFKCMAKWAQNKLYQHLFFKLDFEFKIRINIESFDLFPKVDWLDTT